jgi:pimeloyl-ACP methyl ester carboxylesterase
MLQAGEREGTSELHVVTLIHGTWATKADWIRPRSALSRALRQRLGQDTKVFRFIWSGGNSPSARSIASERLKKKLTLRLRDYATARHHIIGHSHGGNVALAAVAGTDSEKQAGTDLARKIDGIVCLATPFLVARKRDLGPQPALNMVAAITGLCILLMLIVGPMLPASWPAAVTSGIQMAILIAVALPCMVLAMWWFTFATALQDELTISSIDPDRILIVRSPADEASGILVFSQIISWATVRVYLLSQALFARLETAMTRWAERKWSVLVVAAFALVLIPGFVFLLAYSDQPDLAFQSWLRVLAWAGLIVLFTIVLEALILIIPFVGGVDFATALFRFAVSALIWPIMLLLSVFLLPFGWRVALANVLLDVTAETTPIGRSWTVNLVEPPENNERRERARPLMHSIVYENPAALEIVCDWIAKRRQA